MHRTLTRKPYLYILFGVITGIMLLLACSTKTQAQINCPPNLPLTLNGNTEYCVGSSGASLHVVESYDQYEWLPTTESGQDVLLTAGSYQLVVTHYTGCTDTLVFEVEQVPNPPQPVVTASGPTQICQGESVTLSGPPGYPYYEWSSGSVTQSITVYESGTYVLSIRDWIGCESSSIAVDVEVSPQPIAAFSPALELFDVTFNNLSQHAAWYLWDFGDGTTSTDPEPMHTFSLQGNVSMYLVAGNDCGTDTAFLDLTSVGLDDRPILSSLNLYPNPTTQDFKVLYTLQAGTAVSFTLYDLQGRPLQHWVQEGSTGPNLITVATEGLRPGLYSLVLDTGSSTAQLKAIVR